TAGGLLTAGDRSLFSLAGLGALAVMSLIMPQAQATVITGDALNFAVLYSGTGGHNLSISNVTVNGNIGVGGTGVVQFNGPGTINGAVEFAAAQTVPTSQFHNNNGMNVGPTGVTYGNTNVTADLAALSSLSSTYGA